MPLPIILWGVAAALAATGVVKGVNASGNFDKAKSIGRRAEANYNHACEELENVRKQTHKDLEKLGRLKIKVFSNQIRHLVEVIKKTKNASSRLKDFNVEITVDEINEYEKLVLGSLAIEQGLGTGAVGGALAAMGAYGAVGTLATASTGAAISGLSGAAATNATLAWLGGGALSAGGFGMAGGMIALGGVVLGPALAIGGFIMASKAEAALSNAYAYSAQVDAGIVEMEICATVLETIRTNAAEISKIIRKLAKRFDENKVDNGRNASAFGTMATLGMNLKKVLDIPIIGSDGNATANIMSQCSGLLEIT